MNSLTAKIAEEIKRSGPITFARYMEMALYERGLGYYERQREIGRRGDFYTSVSVSPFFGELLAFQFAEWLEAESGSEHLQIIEAGGHDGSLAADILGWIQAQRPALFDRLEYGLIEPSEIHRGWQEEKLRQWTPKVKWFSTVTKLQGDGAARIIFGNEFLDAMPVHRLAWNRAAQQWEEFFVNWENGAFVWRRGVPEPELTGALPEIEPPLMEVFPDGFIFEHSPAAMVWWNLAARALSKGKLLTIDYGFADGDGFRPERSKGTLRTFSRHHGAEDLLRNPGDVDITAHVNFPALEAVGLQAGLTTEIFTEQGRFLTQIFARMNKSGLSASQTRQFQTLTHPEHLGRAFQALVQSRSKL